jgi:hypothetical protein
MTAVGVDLGKTGCRVRVVGGSEPGEYAGPGAPGLADAGGVTAAVDAIVRAVRSAPGSAPGEQLQPDTLAVGAAGADAAPVAAAALAERLALALGSGQVAVTS